MSLASWRVSTEFIYLDVLIFLLRKTPNKFPPSSELAKLPAADA